MQWLQQMDLELFRFINGNLSNPVFDAVMPFLSGNSLFVPVLLLAGAVFLWKVRCRGVVFLLVLGLVVGFTDGFVSRNIKHALGRLRPYAALPDVRQPGKTPRPEIPPAPNPLATNQPSPTGGMRSGSGSMPSSHAANWFAATMVAFLYYRRTVWFMLPMAILVSFSRVYNGVHYPSDVLAGAALGAGGGAAALWFLNQVWTWIGRKWFPLWWRRMPSLIHPPLPEPAEEEQAVPPPRGAAGSVPSPHQSLDAHWLRLSYVLVAALFLGRLAYLASGTIQLAEDEAYQWLWSKHLALSYYSKPPLIAYTQFLGTALWGDTELGVRFFSPVIAAILSVILLRFFAREVNARAGFFLLLIVSATPLLAVGSILMTVDPLSVLFWTAAMLAGWRAVQDDATTRSWLWVGLWMGLGFLSKYTELLQWLCWVVFFVLWPPARKHLRRPGPYLAFLIHGLCTLPVLIWNYQHAWITVSHVADTAGAHRRWVPTAKYLVEFLGSELGLLNPVFFVAACWAAIAFWRRGRHNPRLVYFFSMGAPLFLVYLTYSLRSRLLPNWIAPSVVPLFCLMVVYWDTRWRLGLARIQGWLTTGLVLGFILVFVGHQTDLIYKVTGHYLPVNQDPLHRIRHWSEIARVVGQARQELLAEGKPVFIIASHYGMAGQVSFYLPEARALAASDTPLVYYPTTTRPQNQFFFWPGYTARKGENAIYVNELDRDRPKPKPAPAGLTAEFESVTDLGVRNVLYHGRVLRPLQLFACRGLK